MTDAEEQIEQLQAALEGAEARIRDLEQRLAKARENQPEGPDYKMEVSAKDVERIARAELARLRIVGAEDVDVHRPSLTEFVIEIRRQALQGGQL